MEVKTFVMKNVLSDKETLQDFVECTLDVEVATLECVNGASLVTLTDSIKDFQEAAGKLTENGEIIVDDSLGPLEVLDSGHCSNTVVVENLDENCLPLEFLKLYIESTFADGYAVVSNCKVIPEHRLTILRLTDPAAVCRVLENQDHLPLPSIGYYIQVKPFYANFYQVDFGNPIQKILQSDGAVPLKKNNDMTKFVNDSDSHHRNPPNTSSTTASGFKNSKLPVESDINEFEESGCLEASIAAKEQNELPKKGNTKSLVTTVGKEDVITRKDPVYGLNLGKESSKKIEVETINLPKHKYKLLRNRLNSLEFHMEYNKKDERLTIRSKNASLCKSQVLELAKSVNKSTMKLNEENVELMKKEEVRRQFKQLLGNEAMYDITDNSLAIYSLGNSTEIIDNMIDRFFCTKLIPIPKEIPKEKIREFRARSNDLLLTMKYDNDTITLTGLVEDVTVAKDDLKQTIDDFILYPGKFEVTGKDALFVKKFELSKLTHIFQNVQISSKIIDDEKISFQYSCTKREKKRMSEELKQFKESVKKCPVDLSDLSKEEIALIRVSLKTDHDFIDHFETKNRCCVVFEDFQNAEFFGASAASKHGKQGLERHMPVKKKRRPRVPSFHKKQKRVKYLPSCKLQVKPFGNIAREHTELLVCGIDSSFDLNKTNVSKAFMKLDNSLQDQMSTFGFSANGVYVDQRTLPNMKCKAIAFIILQCWQQGVSDQRLKSAVIEVLDTATQMGISSVSFPPLGIGRAFKFPAHETSQAIMTAISSFLNSNPKQSQIKLINCLAPDKYLYTAMNKDVDVIFKKDKCSTVNADGDDNKEDEDGAAVDSDSDEIDTDEESGASASLSSHEGESDELQMEAVNPDSPLSFVIVHSDDWKNKDVASKFKGEVNKKWLFEDYFKPDKDFCWSPKFMNEIIEMARIQGVLVSKVNNPTTKANQLKIKGNSKLVYQMKNKAYDKVMKMSSDNTLRSPLAPKRGTKEFLKFAAYSDEDIPSYWHLKGKGHDSSHSYQMVDVDAKTFKDISDLFVNCWDPALTGIGHDAANIPPNSQIKVTKIQRLENRPLFLRYCMKRKSIFRDMLERDRACIQIEKLTGSKGHVRTMGKPTNSMTRELYHEINEFYLFHGTKGDILASICKQGFDNRLTSSSALFGQGVYLAESSTKSDQYTDPRDSRVAQGTKLTMILTRASLGDVFLCNDKHESVQTKNSTKLKRPPCTTCLKDVCKCGEALYHSVMGDGKWIFREFVVYDCNQCYPEYFITYHRC